MKVRYLLIILITLLLACILPSLYSLFTGVSSGRHMVYYSSVTEHFCVVERDKDSDKIVRKDLTTGEKYSIHEFDSILPLLYYRQLLADGKMPREIQGKKITPKDANEKSFFYRFKPKDKNSPTIGLYPLFESESGRVDLKMPNDVFRLKDSFAFIRPEDNTIDEIKTRKFKTIFDEKGFNFPAKSVAGNPSPRKPYDEGYFVIDADKAFYHFKMIKGEPFLKKVSLPENCVPEFFTPYEPDDRSFYGFLYDEKGKVYVLNTNDYELQHLDCGHVSLENNIISIMGNPLYWTVRVLSKEQENAFAFEALTKKKIAQYHFEDDNNQTEWNKYLFPFEIRRKTPMSRYILPRISWGFWEVFVINILFALCFFFVIKRKKSRKAKIAETAWIFFTGIFGFIAVLSLKKIEV